MSFFKKNLKKIIIIGVVLIAIISVTIKVKSTSNKDQTFDTKKETTITPTRQNIKDEIILAGSIDAATKATLQFQTSGQLNWVGVKVGDKVKKYQAIASLNKDILKKQLQSDFNTYRSSLATFEDTQDKYKSQKEDSSLTDDMKRILIRSQNTLDNSVINYEIQDLTIKYATLVSPIAGVVVDVEQPNNGVNITPSNSTFTIIDPNSIYFSSKIDQEDVPKIKVGNKATIKLDSFPDKTFESEINYIAFIPVAGESNTVYEIRFQLPKENDDLQYRLGMDGDTVISLKEVDNALTIPSEALHQEENQTYVLVKENNSSNLTKKYIKIGIETDTSVEILEGLSENDQVVVSK